MNELKSYNELSYEEKKIALQKAAEELFQEDLFKVVECAFLVQNYYSVLKGIDRNANNFIKSVDVLVNDDSHIGRCYVFGFSSLFSTGKPCCLRKLSLSQ